MSGAETQTQLSEIAQLSTAEASLVDAVRILGGVSAETSLVLSLGEIDSEVSSRLQSIVGHVLLHAESIRGQLTLADESRQSEQPGTALQDFEPKLEAQVNGSSGNGHAPAEALHDQPESKVLDTPPRIEPPKAPTRSDRKSARPDVSPQPNESSRANTVPGLDSLLKAIVPIEEKPNVGDVPQITIVGDNKLTINGAKHELSEAETLIFNLLLERKRFNLSNIVERFEDITPQLLADLRASLHKICNQINNQVGGAIEKEGKTRGTKYRLAPSIIVADTRASAKGGEQDFLDRH